MPFLAPIAPLLIKAGIGFGASKVGSMLTGGDSKDAKAGLAAQQNSILKNQELATQTQGQGSNFLNLAGQSFNPVVDYWSKLLSPNRGAATGMLAPQLNQIEDQYQATTQAASELAPRGGGRATLLSSLPYQQARDQQSLLQTARPQAAAGLAQVGGQTGGLGSGLISNSIAALNGATSAGRSMLDYAAQKRQSDRELGNTMGKSIFQVLNGINIPKMGGGKTGAPNWSTGE